MFKHYYTVFIKYYDTLQIPAQESIMNNLLKASGSTPLYLYHPNIYGSASGICFPT